MVYYWQFYPKHLSSKFQCCISLYVRNINENLSKMSNILKLVNGKNSITGTQKGKLTTLRKYFQPCKLHIHSSCVYYDSYNYAEYWVNLKSLSLYFSFSYSLHQNLRASVTKFSDGPNGTWRAQPLLQITSIYENKRIFQRLR